MKREQDVYIEGNIIKYNQQVPYKIFSRKFVLQFIKEKYGDDLAFEIDKACSIIRNPKPCIQIYLKSTKPEKSNKNKLQNKTPKPSQCPKCESEKIAEFIYGEQPFEDEKNMIWGGSVITGNDPNWMCINCNTLIYRKRN